ncbi:MFS transporter [Sinosporangium album]|uniref:MFS transporter n=1 Tax=Sinosporangium album TaxID=504805 RepID=UPI001C40A2B4
MAYALAFFFRPLGGLLLGRLADLKGRRLALLYSIALMAGGSLVIGLLPTFDQIGWFAPLLVARIGQGIAVGGEAADSNVYLAELASPSHRGRYRVGHQLQQPGLGLHMPQDGVHPYGEPVGDGPGRQRVQASSVCGSSPNTGSGQVGLTWCVRVTGGPMTTVGSARSRCSVASGMSPTRPERAGCGARRWP